MTSKIRIRGMLLLLCISFIACKKSETSDPVHVPTTLEKILGKWKFESVVENNFYSGSSHITTLTGTAPDYADFRSDGKLYSSFQGYTDTTAYGIISDKKMWIDRPGDTNEIKVLTGTNFQIYQKEIYNPTEYYESTVNLKK